MNPQAKTKRYAKLRGPSAIFASRERRDLIEQSDLIWTAAAVVFELVAVCGALLLLYNRLRPLVHWKKYLVVVRRVLCVLGFLAAGILIYKTVFGEFNRDRMTIQILYGILGLPIIAALIAYFCRP